MTFICAPHGPVGIKRPLLTPAACVKQLNGVLEGGDATCISGVFKFGLGRECKFECGESVTETYFEMRGRPSRPSKRRLESVKRSAVFILQFYLANEHPNTDQTGGTQRVGPVLEKSQETKCAQSYNHQNKSKQKKPFSHRSFHPVEG